MEEEPSSQSASSNDTPRHAEPPKQTTMPSQDPQNPEQPAEPKPPSKLKRLWTKLGLDPMTLKLMLKGSIPPTTAIAMYQSQAVAAQYSTIGFLVAITSILGFAILPRGKFLQTMSLNILATGLAAAVNLLALYCITQARLHTTPAGQPLSGYNSSASVVCAVWLCVQIFSVNALRAARPQFQFPAIIYSIFASVTCTTAVQFPNMAAAVSFMQKLLEAFLTGFALATGTNLFIFPTSARSVVFKEMTGYLMCLSGMLKAQTAYMQSMETIDPIALRRQREEEQRESEQDGTKKKARKPAVPLSSPLATPASLKLRELLSKTVELHTKLHGDVTPAKREFAIGKLESHDLTELWKMLRMVFIPVTGLSASMDLIQRLAADLHWADKGSTEQDEQIRHEAVENLHFLMKELHTPFAHMTASIDAAIMHVLITLELVPAPKKTADEESKGDQPLPGSSTFAETYQKQVNDFYHSKVITLSDWCKEHDIDLPHDFFDSTFIKPEHLLIRDEHKRERYQRQLFFTLYLEYLSWRAGSAVLDLVLWADRRKQEGALKRNKLIFPGSKTLYKWFWAVFGREDFSNDGSYLAEMDSGGAEATYLGEDFMRRKDPEHLPPRNAFERMGESVRKLPRFFRSDESAFGFRVVCATMTIAITCYLEASQAWFLRQRLLWAMIMVAISMSRTAGQSTFNFSLRIFGTLVAMLGSYIIWYIVDGHAAGAIVFLWLWMCCAYYVILKFPKLIIVAILSLVTAVLIIGYELQVQVLGVKVSESNGQPAYPTYELAPYRLACVAGGLLVAFIWTIFPFPISESTELRKDIGASLYLLSNFYSIVHETVRARITGTDGDVKVMGTHAYHLEKARDAVFSKSMLLLNNLKTNSQFSKFQLRVGGRFPAAEYEGLIESCQRVLQYTALMSHASLTFSTHNKADATEESQWARDFRQLVSQTSTTSHKVTSLLALLSTSMSYGQPLPPYLEMPQPFQFVKKVDSIDPDLLSIRHIAEPEYSAFAVIQVCSQAVHADLEKLKKHVTNLVGEIDFAFHAVQTSQGSTDSASDFSDGILLAGVDAGFLPLLRGTATFAALLRQLLADLHETHELFKVSHIDYTARSLDMAARKVVPYSLKQRLTCFLATRLRNLTPVGLRLRQTSIIPQALNNRHGSITTPRTSRYPTREIHFPLQISLISDHDDLEGFTLEMTRPACGDYRMHLRFAPDPEDCHLAICGELGRRVGAAFDFCVDFCSCGEETRDLEDGGWVGCFAEGVPC
ncbi:hypothetical protein LTR82_012621 [Friedmanniomyces endolithicus]|uniref:ER transporter 6TM N-terminal domain-containing protein n=1 Tax=Friedmanniomyces endolithicus TaxID=329885 RepID=A0AAN6J4T7_9PEZI|nr:hypothetical protein LTR82_012621 [Friedmanniomyces endolithicus]